MHPLGAVGAGGGPATSVVDDLGEVHVRERLRSTPSAGATGELSLAVEQVATGAETSVMPSLPPAGSAYAMVHDLVLCGCSPHSCEAGFTRVCRIRSAAQFAACFMRGAPGRSA